MSPERDRGGGEARRVRSVEIRAWAVEMAMVVRSDCCRWKK